MRIASLGQLTSWDRRLIERHLPFYQSLAQGRRQPSSEAQKRFVEAVSGQAEPTTQHEIAYLRFLAAGRARIAAGGMARVAATPAASLAANSQVGDTLDRFEDLVGVVEASPLLVSHGERTGAFLARSRGWWSYNAGKFGRGARDLTFWLTAALADREWARDAGGWLGEQFNTLSNVYTQAMDGTHAEGLRAGAGYVSPLLHRIFDGHSLADSWGAVRGAVKDDTFFAEVANWVAAYSSDLSSYAGMPIATIPQQAFEGMAATFAKVGISTEWVADAATFNLEEILSCTIPGLAVLLRWNEATTGEFRKMIGAMLPTTLVSANPFVLILLVVALAKAFVASGKVGTEGVAEVAEGGLLSGLVLATSATLAGPVWIGMVAGILLAMFARKLGREVDAMAVVGRVLGQLQQRRSGLATIGAGA